MTSKYDSYQVICIGTDCSLYNICGNKCILKSKFKKWIKGCNYGKSGDCEYCSHKQKCVLIKPFSEELDKIEKKRFALEKANKQLYEYIREWDEIEKNLDKYKVNSVSDVIYFKRNRQKMVDKIKDNERLIKAYREKEENLLNE